MKIVLISLALFLAGCSVGVGYHSQGATPSEGEKACKQDCEGQLKVCSAKESGCEKNYSECIKQCDRWSGLRSEKGGAVSVDLSK